MDLQEDPPGDVIIRKAPRTLPVIILLIIIIPNWEFSGGEGGRCSQVLEGHTDEIFSCAFNYEGDHIITGSKDNTCRIWKASS